MDIFQFLEIEYKKNKVLKHELAYSIFLMIVCAISWVIIISVINDCIISAEDGLPFSGIIFVKFIIALLLNAYSTFVSRRKIVLIVEHLISSIRERILANIDRMELWTYEKIGRSELYNALTMDMQYLERFVDSLWYFLSFLILAVLCLIYLASLSFSIFGITLAAIAFFSIIYRLLQSRFKQLLKKSRIAEGYLFEGIEGLTYGFKELKINQQKNDHYFAVKLDSVIEMVKKAKIKLNISWFDTILVANFNNIFLIIMVVFLLPSLNIFSKEVLLASVSTIKLMPLIWIYYELTVNTAINISLQRILELEEKLNRLDQTPTRKPLARNIDTTVIEKIEYCDMKFQYTNEQGTPLFSIGPFNITFHAGEVAFITGGNGSGKSTLLKLMTGLYLPLKGCLKLNDQELALFEQREFVSCIFTDFHLFDQAYGLGHVNTKTVNDMIKVMKLSEKVQFVDGRFSELALSTGQRKRLRLIVALLEDKPIYFFDEWAADQSPEFREYFYHHILPDLKKRNKIVVCVTHDDRYFDLADKLYKLEIGQFVEADFKY